MRQSHNASSGSRDAHLTLKRVERQQHLIAILSRTRRRRTYQDLANDVGVTPRTVARDIERLRHSGVPITVAAGRNGGAALDAALEPLPLHLDLAEVAALISSLAAVGPTASEPAESAMTKLVGAISQQGSTAPSVDTINVPGQYS